MYFNPFRDFITRILAGSRRMRPGARLRTRARRARLSDRGLASFASAVEVCEARQLLSGPQLVQVVPNGGSAINLSASPSNATVENQAPTQLTFTFSPGSVINPTSLGAITVTRAGGDGIFGNANDVAVGIGSIQVDTTNANQVILRFQDTLVNDIYQIHISGTLTANTGAFNGGVAQNVNFQVDFGSQVISVVPQPVLRTTTLNTSGLDALLNVGGGAQTTDGDTFTASAGGASVTFQFVNSTGSVPLGPGNVPISYHTADTADVVAGDIATALNGSALAGSVTASSKGGLVTLVGAGVSPIVTQPGSNTSTFSITSDVNQITNGDSFTLSAGSTPITFQFQNIAGPVVLKPGNIGILYNTSDSASAIAADIVSAIGTSPLAGAVSATQVGSGVQLSGAAFNPVVTLSLAKPASLSLLGARTTLLNVADASEIFDGDTFSIAQSGNPVVFQFTNVGLGSVPFPGNVAVPFNSGDSANALANSIAAAINGSTLSGSVLASATGTSVALTGVSSTPGVEAFSPQVALNTFLPGFLSVTANSLAQSKNVITVYFNQDPLPASIATDPAFYQVINTADGSILQPSSITYNASAHTAALFFGSDIPTGTFHLQIGAPKPNNSTLSSAIDVGTLFGSRALGGTLNGTTTSFATDAFLGNDTAGVSSDVNAVTLYRFETMAVGVITVDTSNLAATLGAGLYLRLFDSTGTELANSSTGSLQVANLAANATYFVGVSSTGNAAYNPKVAGSGSGGSGTGSYHLTMDVSYPLLQNADSTSFATANDLGTLGTAGFTINGAILPLTNIAYPPLPGGSDTPGNRNTQMPGQSNNAPLGTTPQVPVNIPVVYYNFQSVYGTDPQGGTLLNAITENQKNDARQIFDMYGRYMGVKFVETAGAGITIVTGDVRAHAPNLDASFPNFGANALPGLTFLPSPYSASTHGQGEVVIINANNDYGSSPYGGAWFATAFQYIGEALGLAPSADAPGVMSTITPSQSPKIGTQLQTPTVPGQGIVANPTPIEPVFPGDIAVVPSQVVNPPVSTDLNLYKFQLTQSGTFSAETIAQRLKAAIASSDLGTNGAVTLSFTALAPVQSGNEISLSFSIADLGAGVAPAISVTGNQISVVLNSDASSPNPIPTTAQQLVNALNADPTAGSMIVAQVANGDATTVVANQNVTFEKLILQNGKSDPSLLDSVITLYSDATTPAKATTDYNTGGKVVVTYTAKAPGAAGNGLSLVFTKADLGANVAPAITVNGAVISVVLNTDAVGGTTATTLVNAINADLLASNLVSAAVTGGSVGGSTNIATPAINYSPLTLSGGTGSRTIIARNDNYFGRDSLVNLHLAAGTYFVAVSSVGNTNFDPSIPDSGAGGRTDGAYQLKLNFTPDPAKSATTMSDAGGVSLSGDGVNTSGKAFNFWFQSGNTIFVDKANGNSQVQDGTLANPYSTISAALNAAAAIGAQNPATASTDFNTFGLVNVTYTALQSGPAGAAITVVYSSTDLGPVGPAPLITVKGNVISVVLNSDSTTPTTANDLVNALNGDPVASTLISTSLTGDGTQDISATTITDSHLALPGIITIVRIEGNAGSDGNPNTTADSLPYLIGFASDNTTPEPDGSTFVIPQGVNVMIDAGAVLKLHSAIIDVGHNTPNVNDSGASLQVLGTPRDQVVFTSLFNNAIGGTSDPLFLGGPSPGDWGGIVYRQNSDFQGFDSLGNGVFLDSVNQADFTFGGGQVLDDSVLTVFDPIYIANADASSAFFARPAIWFDSISSSADSAMSADPNSFANTEDRVGPDVYGNELNNNSINAFFIRIRTNAGEPIDVLGLPARITHTDVVYVLAENLFITGNPGGPSFLPNADDALDTEWDPRVAGSLVVDPGVIMKLSGARIQTQVGGSQFVAEGTASNPVIFTSLADDSYGAAGTFDTNADGSQTSPAPGDWGGMFFNADSSASIDHAVIQYAGGQTTINGGFAHFNPIEIQQANVRIANSVLQFNASGDSSGDADPFRNGLQGNDGATIFVRGAQPVIVNNTFLNNAGFMISVNANALNSTVVPDGGDITSAANPFTQFVNNHGPLVALNRSLNNQFNGMEVRAEEVTTQTIWDDTDIVHVVTGAIDDVINQHTFGGIRLQSDATSNLVVKLLGAGAGFFVDGLPLDNSSRIGGAIQIVGSSGHPVVLTSLNDDTVGAGFRTDGQPQLDTNGDGNATKASSGDWAGISLGPYANDRNVATVIEQQPSSTTDNNAISATAQPLGSLAPDLATDTQSNPQAGNDYQPVGFDIHGSVSQPSDVDVYSFSGTAGTEVWFQIGMSSPALASVLELVDSKGNVLASSNASTGTNVLTGAAGITVLPVTKNPDLGGAYYSSNPRDAMMRVILPGTAGTTNTYFIRVRSDHALTQGQYDLQVRLRQQWETAGSLIQYSNISYATTGINVQGLANNSPLAGDAASVGTNNSFANAQNLGNLLASNQGSSTVAGQLNNANQVDWYKFNVNYDLVQSFAGVNDNSQTFAAIMKISYASGLARPDATISLFDSTGKLIFVARDSNNTSSQPGPLEGNGLTDLSRGSAAQFDPFLGSVQLPAGDPASPNQGQYTYYVAVSSNAQIPTAMDATFTKGSTNQNVRLQPVSSSLRIVEDHIGFTGHTTGDVTQSTNIQPQNGALLPIDTVANLQTNIVAYTLADVQLFNSSGTHLFTSDAFSGPTNYDIGAYSGQGSGIQGNTVIKMRSDGLLTAYQGVNIGEPDGQVGQIVVIDPATGAESVVGGDNIPEIPSSGVNMDPNALSSDTADAIMWIRQDNTQGGGNYQLWVAADDATGQYNGGIAASRLYRLNPTSGGIQANSPFTDRGEITFFGSDATIGQTTGMEVINNNLNTAFGVSSTGKFFTIDLFSGHATLIKDFGSQFGGFTGLTLGPQNLTKDGTAATAGYLANILFASTSGGKLIALDTSGNLQAVFAGGATSVTLGAASSGGIAFSPLDFNLWHPTTMLGDQIGTHGIQQAPDNSVLGGTTQTTFLNDVGSNTDQRLYSEQQGAASMAFGLEQWVQVPSPGNDYITYGTDAQYGVQTSNYQKFLTENPTLAGFTPNIGNNNNNGVGNANYNLPGGARGTMDTNSFNLAGYSSGDLPTLYFNYLLGSENDGSLTQMTDSARVLVSVDNGKTWQELATNNVTNDQGLPSNGDELPIAITPSITANPNDFTTAFASNYNQQQVQPLYNTATWRQARIDLSNYAGQANVKLRFDFSTAGAAITDTGTGNQKQGQPGDQTGVGIHDKKTGQNNQFAGFYVDDIIVGLANRGEMVTTVANSGSNLTSFTPLPVVPGVGQSLTGPYELDIRPGQPYALITPDNNGSIYYLNSFGQQPGQLADFPPVQIQGAGLPPTGAITAVNDPINFGTAIGYPPYQYTPTAWNLGTSFVYPLAQTTGNQRMVAGYSLTAPAGNALVDGQTFTVSDGVKTVTFEFDSNNTLNNANDQRVGFTNTDTNITVARSIRDAINAAASAGKFKVTAELTDGTIIGTTSTDPSLDLINAVAVSSISSGPDLTVNIPGGNVSTPPSISENGGVITGATVTHEAPFSAPLTVTLSVINSVTGLPATDVSLSSPTVTFAAGSAVSTPFTITGVNDALANGIRSLEVIAKANGYTSISAPVDVLDDETAALSLVINTPTPITEPPVNGTSTGTATVSRNTVGALDTQPLVVTLTSLDPSRLSVPASVTIPAGQTAATFTFNILQDGVIDQTTGASINAAADSFKSVSTFVPITDTRFQIPVPQVGPSVDVTPGKPANQTDGSIAVDHVFSAFTDFTPGPAAGAVTVAFAAKTPGTGGSGITIKVLTQDLGAGAQPTVSVVGRQITVTLNTNAGNGTTAQQLVDAINNFFAANPNSPAAISAVVSAGTATTDISSTGATSIALNNQALFAISTTELANGLVASISLDNGQHWSTSTIALGAAGDLPLAFGTGSQPQVTADDFGNLFLVYVNKAGNVDVAGSTDFGQHFTLLKEYAESNGATSPAIAANAGSVWIAYTQVGKNLLAAGASNTGLGIIGAFPGTQETVVTQNGNGPNPNFPSIAIGPGGAVFVAWEDTTVSAQPFNVNVSVDTDGLGPKGFTITSTASTTTVGANHFSPASFGGSINAAPEIAVDQTTGKVYVAYVAEVPGQFGNTDIFLRQATYANSLLSGFSGPTQVNTDTGTNSQIMPRIAVDNGNNAGTRGDVVVTWLDARNAGFANNTVQEFAEIVTQQGTSFGPNLLISAAAPNGTINSGTAGSSTGLGDYTGLDFVNGSFFPIWSDNSTGLAGNTDRPHFDEATANVSIVNPASEPAVTVTMNVNPLTAGTTTPNAGTVSIPVALATNLTVLLTSSNTAVATVPVSVTIPAGTTSANFTVTTPANGATAFVRRTAVITGAATGYESVASAVDVLDPTPVPALTLTFNSNSTVAEGGQITGTVTRNTPTTNPLTVTIYQTAPDETTSQQTVTILATQTSATFTLTGVEDFQVDGNHTVQVVAAAPGLESGRRSVTVVDSGKTIFNHYTYTGDQQIVRQQGHLQIVDNTISFSSQYGISVTGGPRDANGSNLPHPGSVRNLPTLDTNKLVPGPDIVSNIIDNFGVGGILFAGDPDQAGNPTAAVPYGRIVNNTIYGALNPTVPTTPNTTGITVQNNAGPTILNNIVSNTNLGISVDASSTANTVVGTEVFENNLTKQGFVNNGVVGTNAIQLATNTPMFVNPNKLNFYLVEGSQAIDSSLNSLADRPQIAAVLSAVGIPSSPIISPPTDRFGQLRVDDPNVPNATGLGSNIFIDRGAVERADFVGPTSQLTVPLDNGPGDGDPTVGKVFIISNAPLTQLAVTLNDVGSGIDDSSASKSSAYVLTQDGKTLVAGTDYIFVYNANTHTAQFNSVSVFNSRSVYTITLNTTVIKDLAGNALQGNQPNGTDVLTIVGNGPPLLTTVKTLTAFKNLTDNITYAQLLAASDLSVVGSHTPEFIIQSVKNGTLTITHLGVTSAVQPGVTIFVPGDTLNWSPQTGFTGQEAAFTVLGYDPQNAVIAPALAVSSSEVTVNINVVDLSPTLTFVNPLSLAGLNSPFQILYSTLLANSDAKTNDGVAGNPVSFQVTEITSGTLQLVHNGVTTSAGIGTILNPGDSFIWTPPLNVSDVGGVPVDAFKVVAYDPANVATHPTFITSTPPVQVSVHVSTQASPTLLSIDPFTKPRFVPDTISFSELATNAHGLNFNAMPGDIFGFRVDTITAGTTLTITHNATTTPVVPGVTLVVPGDVLTWTSAAGATSPPDLPAFTVAAFNQTSTLASVDAQVSVTLVNLPPVIQPIATLQIADQQTAFKIAYSTLLAGTSATDPNNDVVSFRISRTPAQAATGTLTLTHNGVTTNVVSGVTIVGPGDFLTFTGATGVVGTAVNAFSIVGIDPSNAVSSTTDAVTIDIRPFGSAFDLTGEWTVSGGLAQISQSGANLTLVDNKGQGSNWFYTSGNTIGMKGTKIFGTIDTTVADQGRIVFSNGVIWQRLQLGGTWLFNGALATVTQNRSALTFSQGGTSFSGSLTTPTTIRIVLGTTVVQGTLSGGTINFANGMQLLKLDLPLNFSSSKTGPSQILQDGTTTLTFVDGTGHTSTGNWINTTQMVSNDAKGMGSIRNGTIFWSNGDVWSENLTMQGTKVGAAGTTSIVATPTLITLTDTNGAVSHARLVNSSTIVVIDGAMNGLTGSRGNGQITWSNGAVWTNFDFNALSALFWMVQKYPFP